MINKLSTYLIAAIAIICLSAGNWQRISSKKYTISFPEKPQLLQKSMPSDMVEYEIYVSSSDHQMVYFFVTAKYPVAIEKDQEKICLDGFLEGMLLNNPGNELITYDESSFNGHLGYEFVIQNENYLFKGKILIANQTLYLLATECEKDLFQSENLQQFINSFALID